MGLFDGLRQKIAEKQRRDEELAEEREVLAKARHEARLKSAQRIAEAEEEQYIKNLKEGKKQANSGFLNKLIDGMTEAGQNLNANMAKGNAGLFGSDFGSPEPSQRKKRRG